MQVPRFWEKATVRSQTESFEVGCWGWSPSSPEEARSRAAEAARRVAQHRVGDLPQTYWYDERLPREEIIDEFNDDRGDVKAFVTRNSYGALVLNTRDLVFIDVDLPPKPAAGFKMPAFLAKWIGAPAEADPVSETEEAIRSTARQYSELAFRLYRTKNGFRVVVANQPMEAKSALSLELLERFRADPLYVRMCKNQDCFRARLTPKAWRCGLSAPPFRYPFANSPAESANRKWEQSYHDAIANRSTCRYVETIGGDLVHQSLADLIELHDKLTKSISSDPLA